MHSDTFSSELHVIFGAGPVGLAVAQELVERGRLVRLVTRSVRGQAVRGVERAAADASDKEQAAIAAQGAQVVYHAAGAGYGHRAELLPPIIRSVTSIADSEGRVWDGYETPPFLC